MATCLFALRWQPASEPASAYASRVEAQCLFSRLTICCCWAASLALMDMIMQPCRYGERLPKLDVGDDSQAPYPFIHSVPTGHDPHDEDPREPQSTWQLSIEVPVVSA